MSTVAVRILHKLVWHKRCGDLRAREEIRVVQIEPCIENSNTDSVPREAGKMCPRCLQSPSERGLLESGRLQSNCLGGGSTGAKQGIGQVA